MQMKLDWKERSPTFYFLLSLLLKDILTISTSFKIPESEQKALGLNVRPILKLVTYEF